jgi:hypothetical protein
MSSSGIPGRHWAVFGAAAGTAIALTSWALPNHEPASAGRQPGLAHERAAACSCDSAAASSKGTAEAARWSGSPLMNGAAPLERDAGVSSPALGPNEVAERSERARHAANRISWRARLAAGDVASLEGGVEGAANAIDQYVHGWLDSVTETQPELLEPLGSHLSRLLCEENPSEVETLVVARVLLHAGSRMQTLEQGMRCVLRRHRSEDVVLWGVLDAWTHAGLGATREWDDWRQRASDTRTLRRLGLAPQARSRLSESSGEE